jgi:hypothetical protein
MLPPKGQVRRYIGRVDAREERLARNEVLFRDVNERIEQVAARQGSDPHVFEFLCECSNLDCSLRLPLTLAEYEIVRADPASFVVALGHELPEIEDVVRETDRFQIVRKHNEAARLAAARDPRS